MCMMHYLSDSVRHPLHAADAVSLVRPLPSTVVPATRFGGTASRLKHRDQIVVPSLRIIKICQRSIYKALRIIFYFIFRIS